VISLLIKFISFALVGVLGTLAHYAVLYALVEWQGYTPIIATAYGALVGLLVNYILNFKLTFNSGQRHAQTFPKFALIACCGMGFNLLFMTVLTPHFYYLYAQVLTTILVLIWNFFANFLWTFKMDKASPMSEHKLSSFIKKTDLLVGLLLSILVLRLLSLGLYPLYDPSESRYAEMARKMVETDNWVTPMIEYGVPFWGKPPLTIWLTALSLDLGGLNEYAARVPSLLLSLAVVWIVFYLVKVQRNVEQAIATVFVLSSSVLFFVMSGTVAMDLALNLGITLALAAFWLALRGEQLIWGYVFFLGLSIGMLAKGPITLVLAGASIGLWTLLTGRWLDIWKHIPWIKGTLLMLVICTPWYWLAEQRTPGFLEYFFIGEHWKRFTEPGWQGDLYGAGRGHTHGTIWLYWLAGGFPWSILLSYRLLKRLMTGTPKLKELFHFNDHWALYCWLWMLAPLLFFTVAANIIWTYVLPALAGLALLTAPHLTRGKRWRVLLGLAVPLGFWGLIISYQFLDADFYNTQKRLVESYTRLAKPGEQLVYLKEKVDYSAQFYLQGKIKEVLDIRELQAQLAEGNHDFYVLRKVMVNDLPETLKLRLQPVKTYGKYILFQAIGGQ
jgi:4-amino-4-deoxy-L-arabinose transferase-like glycosyltransferase